MKRGRMLGSVRGGGGGGGERRNCSLVGKGFAEKGTFEERHERGEAMK